MQAKKCCFVFSRTQHSIIKSDSGKNVETLLDILAHMHAHTNGRIATKAYVSKLRITQQLNYCKLRFGAEPHFMCLAN